MNRLHDDFSPPDVRETLACPVSEDHELAFAVDDYDEAYCIDCGKRQKLVPKTTIRVRP